MKTLLLIGLSICLYPIQVVPVNVVYLFHHFVLYTCSIGEYEGMGVSSSMENFPVIAKRAFKYFHQ